MSDADKGSVVDCDVPDITNVSICPTERTTREGERGREREREGGRERERERERERSRMCSVCV